MAEPPQEPRGRRGVFPVLAALLVGLVLASLGIGWGLPDADHVQSYHGGESRAVGVAQQMDWTRGDLEPRWRGEPFFRWGSHALYAFHGAQWLASVAGLLEVGGEPATWTRRDVAHGHLVSRWVSVAYAVGTIALIAWIGRFAFGRDRRGEVGTWAALATALCPLLAYEARFATSNTCLTFWCTAAVGLLIRASRRGTAGAFAGAGVAVGLAVGAKLSALALGAPAAIAALLAAVTRDGSAREGSAREGSAHEGSIGASVRVLAVAAVALVVGGLAGFLAVTPYALVHPEVFWEHAVAEVLEHSREGHGLVFSGTGNGFAYLAFVNLPVSLSHPLWVAGALGFATLASVGLARGTVPDRAPALIAAVWIGANLFVLGRAEVRYPRYLMPVCPFLALAAAYLLHRLREKAPPPAGPALVAVGVLTLAWAGLQTLANVLPFTRPDPKDQALAWFDAEVPAGTSVAFLKRPSHLTPPIHPLAGDPFGTGDDPRVARRADYRWVFLDARPDALAAERPDLVVVNELEVRAELRVDPADLADDPRLARRAEGVRALWAALQRDYAPPERSFENEARLGPLSFAWCSRVRGWAAATQRIDAYRRRAP